MYHKSGLWYWAEIFQSDPEWLWRMEQLNSFAYH